MPLTPDALTPEQQRLLFFLTMQKLGTVLINSKPTDIQKWDEASQEYFGDTARHHSLHREDRPDLYGNFSKKAAHPKNLTSFASTIGDLHEIISAELPKRLHARIQLNESALKPETQATLKALRKNMVDYRAAVNSGSAVEIERQEEKSIAVYAQLLSSELMNPMATVPLRVGEKDMKLQNSEQLGAFLVALQIGKQNILDAKKVPLATARFLVSTLGRTSEIPANIMSKVAGSHPELKAQCNEAFSECLPPLLEGISKGKQPLQMLCLVGDTPPQSNAAQGAEALLFVARERVTPEKLESDRDLKLVMSKLANAYASRESTAALAMYDNYRQNTLDSFTPLPQITPAAAGTRQRDDAYDEMMELAENYLKTRSPSLPDRENSSGMKR